MGACPTCDKDGEYYAGTPKAEAAHFAARTIWAAHRTRQALQKLAMVNMSEGMSDLIRDFEAFAYRILGH